jgi:hypothetical protein
MKGLAASSSSAIAPWKSDWPRSVEKFFCLFEPKKRQEQIEQEEGQQQRFSPMTNVLISRVSVEEGRIPYSKQKIEEKK